MRKYFCARNPQKRSNIFILEDLIYKICGERIRWADGNAGARGMRKLC
jgi:hypothetical protein